MAAPLKKDFYSTADCVTEIVELLVPYRNPSRQKIAPSHVVLTKGQILTVVSWVRVRVNLTALALPKRQAKLRQASLNFLLC